MKKVERVKINVPIYSVCVDCYLGDIQNLGKVIKKDYHVQIVEDSTALSQVGGIAINLEKDYAVGGTLMMAVDNFWNCTFSYSLPLVMHELIHIANMLIGNRGMKADNDDDENLAYISSFIFDAFLQKIGIDTLKIDENDEKNSKKSSKSV